MLLRALPLVFVLAGLALYTVLAGADFGAGIWQLTARRGRAGAAIRDEAHNSMGPVWEANHVWLIFVLTVTWTAYPAFFGSVASTLSVALSIAAVGIVLRGASYALRSGARTQRETQKVDQMLGIASVLTPFALGAAAGGIAAQRVPVGNAAGHLFSSWLNPTAVCIGALSVAFSAYLAAVFLAGDATRRGEVTLAGRFRARALCSGLVAGTLSIVALAILHEDVSSLYRSLTHGAALGAVLLAIVAGLVTLGLVARRHYEAARLGAATAVGAVIAGWALARYPVLLPHLSVAQAAASHDTLICVLVAVLGGATLLLPSLAVLFALTLRGTLRPAQHPPQVANDQAEAAAVLDAPFRGRLVLALLTVGAGLLIGVDTSWARALGMAALVAFMVTLATGLVGIVLRGPE